MIVKEDGEYEYRFGKKGDVNPGLLRVPIGILYAKWSPVRAPILKVSHTGIFCQTDDYIDPQKVGQISRLWIDLAERVIRLGNAAGTRLCAF